MSKPRFVLLVALVIASAGATVWLASAAVMAGQLNRQVLMALLPLVMLGSIAFRALTGRKDE